MVTARRRRVIVIGLLLACLAAGAAALLWARGGEDEPANAVEAPGEPGRVRYMKGAMPEFDRFSSDPRWTDWISDHFWRMRTYTPFFDDKTGRYAGAWFYRNAYGIATESNTARNHPEWILKDASGTSLYIPWNCSGGACPLYAGDVANQEFRAFWVAEARKTLARGYKGIWIDDVNMPLRVANGDGDDVAPIDPRAGGEMTRAAWRRGMADFMEEVRDEFPDAELAHNAIWYAEQDADVARQLAAADFINLERGVNDEGLRGGTGTFGFASLLEFIDERHDEDQGVIFDAYADGEPEREYGLASYFLVNDGKDAYSNGTGSSPDDWWAGFDVDLGNARGRRYAWKGLLRRDFDGGIVLVNQPEAPAVAVALDETYRRIGGGDLRRAELEPAQGLVLRLR